MTFASKSLKIVYRIINGQDFVKKVIKSNFNVSLVDFFHIRVKGFFSKLDDFSSSYAE